MLTTYSEDRAAVSDLPNTAIVKDIIERWNSGDRTPPLEYAHPEIVIVAAVAGAFQREPFKGHDGVQEWLGGLDEAFERWDVELLELEERDDVVVMIGRVRAKGRGSGVELELPTGWVMRFRDGKVFRVHVSRDLDETRAALAAR